MAAAPFPNQTGLLHTTPVPTYSLTLSRLLAQVTVNQIYSPAHQTWRRPDGASIYRNEMAIPTNHPPLAPTNLLATVGPGSVTFQWGNASDDITPPNLLTYNLRVGTNSLGTSIVSPLANVTNGWRKIAAPGNCGHIFSTTYHFQPGTYYWSIQAVDGAFAGGAWGTEQTFTITDPERPILNITTSNLLSTVRWPARFNDYTLEQSASFSAINWSPLTNTYYDNAKLAVGLTNRPGASFFRLKK
jgi:hypothetical protein